MGSPAILAVKIISDAKNAQAGLDQTSTKFGKLKKFGKAAGLGIAAAGAAAVALGKKSVSAASDLEDSTLAAKSIFETQTSEMTKFAKHAADSVGLSQTAYQEMATKTGAILKGAGTPMKDLAGDTDKLITKASDLAATFGGSTNDAMKALTNAMTGRYGKIMRDYGVTIDKNKISAEAAALGYKKVDGEFKDNAKSAAAMSLIMKKTKDTQGAFADGTDTLSEKQQILSAKWENAKAKLGQVLLPVVEKVFGFFTDTAAPAVEKLIGWLSKLDFSSLLGGGDAASKFSGILDTLKTTAMHVYKDGIKPMIDYAKTSLIPTIEDIAGTVIPPLVAGFKKVAPIVGDVLTAMMGLQKAIAEKIMPVIRRLAPVVATVFGVVADIIGKAMKVVSAIIKTATALISGDWSGAWDGIKKIFSTTWDLIKSIVTGALKIIKSALSAAWSGIKATMTTAWGKIRGAMGAAWTRVKSAVTSGISKTTTEVGKLPGKAVSALGKLGSKLWQSGRDLIQGFINGIWNKASSIASTIKNAITDRIPGWIKGPLGIGSPSKLMADIAQWIPAGIAEGIAGNTRVVTRELDRVSRGIGDTRLAAPTVAPFDLDTRRVRRRAASAASGAGRPVSVNIEFSGVVGDPQAVAQQIGDLLRDRGIINGATA